MPFLAQTLKGVSGKDLRGLIDEHKARLGSGVILLVADTGDKAAVAAGVTDDLTGRISAVDLVRVAAEALGGKGGGGRPDMAQAGGSDPARAPRRSPPRARCWRPDHAQGIPDRPHRRHRPGALRQYTAVTPASRQVRGPLHRPRRALRGEGGGRRARNAVIEFPDYESALAFYDDPEYRAALPHAVEGSEREVVIVEGATDAAYWIAHVP